MSKRKDKSKIDFDLPIPGLTVRGGMNVKYLSVLKSRYWEDAKLSPSCLSDDLVNMTWEATDKQEGHGAVLTSFSGGPSAQKVRMIASQSRDLAYSKVLEQLLPGYGANLIKSRFMDWPADPWSMGSYSFPPPGHITTIGPLQAQGVSRVHFAGEHTCYKFVGYMEGALSSGVSVARKIATRDGIQMELD